MNKQIPSNFIDVNRVLQSPHWKTIILKCDLCGFTLIRKVGGDMDDWYYHELYTKALSHNEKNHPELK